MADFHTIQSSFTGALALSYVEDGCMLKFSKVFKPISPKEIQKGMKIYDYQNAKYFKLDMKELTTISNILKRLLSGKQFQDMQGKYGGVEVNGQGLKVTHFPQGGNSSFSIFVNSEGNRAGQLTIGLASNVNGQEFKMYTGVDNEDLGIFIKFLDSHSIFAAHLCAVDFIKYSQNRSSGNNNNGGGNGNYQNNNQQNSYRNNSNNGGGSYNNNGGNNYNASGNNNGNYQNNNYGNNTENASYGGNNNNQNNGNQNNYNAGTSYGGYEDSSNLIG